MSALTPKKPLLSRMTRFVSFFIICLSVVSALPLYAEDAQTGEDQDRGRDTIVAAILRDGYPTHFYDDRTGRASGFAVDVMDIIAKRAGLRVEYVYARDFSELINLVTNRKADVIPCIGIDEERDRRLDFTRPLVSSPLLLYIRSKNNAVKGLAGSITVGVTKGSFSEEILRQSGNVKLRPYYGFSNGLFDLLSGQIDGFAASEATMMGIAGKAGVEDMIKAVGPPHGEVKRAMAVREGNAALLSKLNSALKGFVGSPEYQIVFMKWYGKPKPYWTGRKIFVAMSVFALIGIFFMGLWRYRSIVALNRELMKTISERKQAAEALQESEERFRSAFETAAIGMSIVSLEGHWLKINPAMCKIIGYSEQELSSMSFRDITYPDDLDINLAFAKSVLAGDIPYYHLEKRYFHKQGHIIWALLSTSLVRDAHGRPLYFVNLIEDITMRKKAEDELRRNEAKYRSLVESTDDSIYLVDRDYNYLFMNGRYLSRLRLEKDHVLGKKYSEFYPPEEVGKFAVLVDEVFKSGNSINYGHKSHRDGRYFIRTLSPVKEPSGNITAVTVVSKDITDHKLAEEGKEKLISELRETLGELESALSEVKKLSGLLPICVSCKKIRDDKGYWDQIESYISRHSEADFTHAVCPECAKELYPQYYKEVWGKEKT